MTIFEATILGVVQGLTELLPVSSTAHLVLVERWLGVNPGLAFDVALHGGTLAAILLAFRADVVRLLRGVPPLLRGRVREDPDARLLGLLLLASVPAGLAGITLKHWISNTLRHPAVIGISLIVVALLILWIERTRDGDDTAEDVGLGGAIAVGLCQTLALVPGVSRSGSTIGGGLLLGLRRVEAVRFSFLLGMPVIGGAVILELPDLLRQDAGQHELMAVLVGTLVAFIVGYVTILALLRYVRSRRFTVFMGYRILLGVWVLWSVLRAS